MKTRCSVLTAALTVLSIGAGADVVVAQEADSRGQEPNQLYQRFQFSAGAFASYFHTTLRADSEERGVGTEIDLEEDLGFDTRKFDFRTGGYLRLGRRHRIGFGYFSLSRNSNKVLDEEIDFGDETFPVDAEVNADFETQFAQLGYNFSFLAREKVEAAVGLGLSAMFTQAGIAAVGSVGDEDIDALQERKSTALPIAALGLSAGWAPLPRLIVRGGIGGLYVKISTIEAAVGNADIGAEYYLVRNFGLGASYVYTKLAAEETEDPMLKVTYRYSGLLLFGTLALF